MHRARRLNELSEPIEVGVIDAGVFDSPLVM